MHEVDLNCDLGESFGVYRLGADDEVLPFVSSVNVACGFHAGDPATMRRTIERAAAAGVSVGAHPGLDDLAGFGRRRMQITAQEAYDLVLYQTGALDAFARAAGGRLNHVKPHGALYNMAARDLALAEAIARAVRDFDSSLVLYGLAGSRSLEAARARGLRIASEVFADRAYLADGSLAPRDRADALITDHEQVARRVVRFAVERRATTLDGTDLRLDAGDDDAGALTICLHGDTPGAPALARVVRRALDQAGASVRAPRFDLSRQAK